MRINDSNPIPRFGYVAGSGYAQQPIMVTAVNVAKPQEACSDHGLHVFTDTVIHFLLDIHNLFDLEIESHK